MRPILDSATLAAQKSGLRARLKQIRARLPAADRARASKKILDNFLSLKEVAVARTVFSYISHGHEVDTHALLRHFLAKGVTVAVPRIITGKGMIAVRFTHWADLTPGVLGILAPSGETPCPATFDIVVTPGLGFTVKGDRIGYGRGYYDRWFTTFPTARKIALAFEAQITGDIPNTEYDIPVDIVITEQRIVLV